MRPAFLLLDDALIQQESLRARAEEKAARTIEAQALGPALRLWSRPPALAALQAVLREAPYDARNPDLMFCGSGDFHHVSCLLIARALEATAEPATVLHFDNHPDWVKFAPGMHCGSWAARAARLPNVARLITLGVCSSDIDRPDRKRADLDAIGEDRIELYPYNAPGGAEALSLCGRRWPSIAALGEDAFIDFLMARIATRNVYVTIDKDVLRGEDAVTNWDQGATSLDFLSRILSRIGQHHRLIGADVVGDWSAPRYGGGMTAACLKQAEALLDQPWARPDAEAARRRNEAVNLKLIEVFSEIAHTPRLAEAS